jgi:hypothetical protein
MRGDTVIGKLILMLCIAAPLAAQPANLGWTASTTPGTSVDLYRATGTCPGTAYALLQANLPAGGPATDATVTVGNTYCWYVTAVLGGIQSPPSNTLQLSVAPTAPSNLTGSVSRNVTKTITYQMAPLKCSGGRTVTPPKLTCTAVYTPSTNSIALSCHT